MMKRTYEKPTVYMETLELDMPIAATCENDVDEVDGAVGNLFYDYLNCNLNVNLGNEWFKEMLEGLSFFNS